MNPRPNIVGTRASLAEVLDRIEANRSASAFVVEDNKLLGYVGIMDIVRWIVKEKIAPEYSGLEIASSPLVTAPADTSLRRVIELMMDKYVRRVLLTRDGHEVGMVDDRVMTNIIFSGPNIARSFREMFNDSVSVHVRPVSRVRNRSSLLRMARRIATQECRCILVEGHGIVTPWDVAVKGLRNIMAP